MVSRSERTRKQRQMDEHRKKWQKRAIVGIGSSILALGISTGAVYASQGGSQESLSEWFSRQVEICKVNIQQAISQETTKQAKKLQSDLEKNKKQAARDLDSYTNEEIKAHIKAIQDYADSLSKSTIGGQGKENAAIRQQLDLILQSSIAQMNMVRSGGIYTNGSGTVNDSVYGRNR